MANKENDKPEEPRVEEEVDDRSKEEPDSVQLVSLNADGSPDQSDPYEVLGNE